LKRFKFFIFNTSFLIITSLIFRGIDIYFTAYISKKIGSEMLGVFNLIMSVYLFGITLATSGINLAVTRVISEELALDNPGRNKKSNEKMSLHYFNYKLLY
jgi:stage V sporulation protein B